MDINALAGSVAVALGERNAILATAESCTGGWLAEVLTAQPGASHWFDRGFITYSNGSKMEMLGVSEFTLGSHGAVSEQTAREMVHGALTNSYADCAVAVTGIAGPGGGTPEKPVGTVWFAWGRKARGSANTVINTRHCEFLGDRESIRRQSVGVCLQGLVALLEHSD